jgi:hypothetical protein
VQPLSGGVVAVGAKPGSEVDRGKVTEGSMESFPASDPPTY